VRIRLLLTRPEATTVASLVDAGGRFVHVDTKHEEVQGLFKKHGVTMMPVVDREGRLVGRVMRNGNGIPV